MARFSWFFFSLHIDKIFYKVNFIDVIKSTLSQIAYATCGCHRKHAIRVLKGLKCFAKPKSKRRGKPSHYQNEALLNPLKEIWLAANQPCSKRLKVVLSIWLPDYVQLFGALSTDVTHALLNISPPTIDRILDDHSYTQLPKPRAP